VESPGGAASVQPRKRKAQTDLKKKKQGSGGGGGGANSSSGVAYKGRTTDFRVLADAFPSLRPLYHHHPCPPPPSPWFVVAFR
jgi:hypothetical protein